MIVFGDRIIEANVCHFQNPSARHFRARKRNGMRDGAIGRYLSSHPGFEFSRFLFALGGLAKV